MSSMTVNLDAARRKRRALFGLAVVASQPFSNFQGLNQARFSGSLGLLPGKRGLIDFGKRKVLGEKRKVL